MTVLLAALGISIKVAPQAPLEPAAPPSPLVRKVDGVTLAGHQVDCATFAKEFGRFPWRGVDRPTKGRSQILLRGGSAIPGRYWLSDDATMTPGIQPSGQIVRVLSSEGFELQLDEPIGIEFRANAKLVAAPIAVDVRLENGNGPISLSLVDGFSIRNWSVPDSWDQHGLARAVSIQSSRGGTIREVNVGAAIQKSAGKGYACQIQRSLDVRVERLTARRVRHAGNVFGGARITFTDCRGIETAGDAFETHGFGAREVLFERCDFGGSNASIGNKYHWADRDVTIWEGRNVKTLFLYGGVEDARAVMTRFSGPLVLATNEAGRPLSASIVGSTFVGYLDGGATHSAGIRFTGRGGIGLLHLYDCTVRDVPGPHARALYIGDVDESTRIIIQGGSLGEQFGDHAIEVNNSGRAQVILDLLDAPELRGRKAPLRTAGAKATRVNGGS